MVFPSIFSDGADLPEYFQKEQPVCEIDPISICLARDVTDLSRTQQTPLTERINWYDVARGKSRGKIIPVFNKSEELPFLPPLSDSRWKNVLLRGNDGHVEKTQAGD